MTNAPMTNTEVKSPEFIGHWTLIIESKQRTLQSSYPPAASDFRPTLQLSPPALTIIRHHISWLRGEDDEFGSTRSKTISW